MPKETLAIPKKTQVRVISDLIENSRLTYDFYLMLVLSAVVVVFGLLVSNSAVIIGGMLITPLLTPILTLALGIVLADKSVIWRSTKIILKSLGIVLAVSVVLSFFFPAKYMNGEITSRLVSNIPYFLIAFSAGLAATFAWAKKDLSVMLPGVAIAVSLLPPLAVVGIGISSLSLDIVRGSLLSFILNFAGIVLGSVIIFSLLNFHKSKKETKKAVKDEARQELQKKDEKIKKELTKEIAQEDRVKEELKEEIKEEVKKEIKR